MKTHTLFKHGRPLGKTIDVLENKNPNQETINNIVFSYFHLKILGDLILNNKKADKSINEDIYKALLNLYLFIPENIVTDYERKRLWKNFGVDDSLKSLHEHYVESDYPADAYHYGNDENNDKILIEMVKAMSFNRLSTIIEFSETCLSNFIEQNKCTYVNKQIENISALYKQTGSNKEEIDTYYLLHIIFKHNEVLGEYLFNFMKEVYTNDMDYILNHISSILDENNDISFTQYSRKSLVNDIGFLKRTPELKYNEVFKSRILQKILDSNDNNDFLSIFITKEKMKNERDINSWSYIESVTSLWLRKIVSNIPVKILLTGESGIGKSSLARSVLSKADKKTYTLSFENEFYNEHDINLLIKLVSYYENIALIVETGNIENKHIVDNLSSFKCPLFYIKNVVSEYNPGTFDYNFKLKSLPFEVRFDTAIKLMPEKKNLAIKIAQYCRNFNELYNIANLITCEEEWENEYHHFFSTQKSSNGLYEIKNLKDEDIQEICGYDEIKPYFSLVKDIFKNPEKYDTKIKMPKGFILAGPAGTGKTLFAKNIVKELNIPLMNVNTSALINDTSLIGDIFSVARNIAPCVLFFDEIDELLIDNVKNIYSNKDNSALNKFLTEMDGVNELSGVLLLGTTNNPQRISKLALRSGRFSKTLFMKYPNKEDRKKIFFNYLKETSIKMEDLDGIASITEGVTAADIAEIVNTAKMELVFTPGQELTISYLDRISEEVIFGKEIIEKGIEKTIYRTSVHEVGHMMLGLKYNRDVPKVTVIPRDGYLGLTYLSNEEFQEVSYDTMKEEIELLMAGVIAEKVVFGAYGGGGTSDLNRVNKICNNLFLKMGYSKTLGLTATDKETYATISEITKTELDSEKRQFLNELENNTFNFLTEKKDLLLNLSQSLAEKRCFYEQDILEAKKALNK